MASLTARGLSKSAALTSFLLVSTSLTAPAYSQIETVIVTAEKKVEDIQTVPIAVTAFSSQDLKSHQIIEFKDLVFATPNVTYSKTNFTGANFQFAASASSPSQVTRKQASRSMRMKSISPILLSPTRIFTIWNKLRFCAVLRARCTDAAPRRHDKCDHRKAGP